MSDLFDLFQTDESKKAELLRRVLSHSTVPLSDAVDLAAMLGFSLTITVKAKDETR